MNAPILVRPEDFFVSGAHYGEPMRALSPTLESRIVDLCARAAPYRIEALAVDNADAPKGLADLLAATRGDVIDRSWNNVSAGTLRTNREGQTLSDPEGIRIPVSSAFSDRTIWSSPRMNYLFRAWHDSFRINLGEEFTEAGERRVALAQCAMIEDPADAAILWRETYGQVMYHLHWGAFPEDQRGFVLHALKHGVRDTVEAGLFHRLPGFEEEA